MTEQPEKQGMPRGCVIGLIVAGALLLLLIALFAVCQIYKDDLIKFSINNTLGGMRKALATNPISGIETSRVDTITTAFSSRFDTTTVMDYDRLEPLVIAVQTAATSGGKFDSATVASVVNGLIHYYPDLDRFVTSPIKVDSATSPSVVNDSAALPRPIPDSVASNR